MRWQGMSQIKVEMNLLHLSNHQDENQEMVLDILKKEMLRSTKIYKNYIKPTTKLLS